jgi:hypothetical protein
MFFIDFHAPCGVLGVEHPDTFSSELLPAIQMLGATNIVTAAPVAASVVSTIIAYGVTPDLPPLPKW